MEVVQLKGGIQKNKLSAPTESPKKIFDTDIITHLTKFYA